MNNFKFYSFFWIVVWAIIIFLIYFPLKQCEQIVLATQICENNNNKINHRNFETINFCDDIKKFKERIILWENKNNLVNHKQ